MRILVTGHKGYIGTILVPMLIAAGHEVTGWDTDYYHRSTFTPFAIIPEIKRDIRDSETVDLKGIDAICHLAALSNDPLGNLNPKLTYEINMEATLNLAARAAGQGVERFIFSSSCSLYGAAAGEDLMTEESPMRPVTPYGKSKALAEKGLRTLATDRFSPVMLRNATAYGVSPRHRFDLVLNNFVAHALTQGRVVIKSDGTPYRPLVHIEDIAGAFLAALTAPKTLIHNEAFNIGRTADNYRVSALAEVVASMTEATVEYAPGGEPDARTYRVDFSKAARQLTGWKTQWNVMSGIMELVLAYRREGITFDDVEGDRFKRVAQLVEQMSSGRLDEQLRWIPASKRVIV